MVAPFSTPGNGSVSALAAGIRKLKDIEISEIGTKLFKFIGPL
jgi:hypothetical protein